MGGYGLSKYLYPLWPFMETSAGSDRRDQRASVILDYLLPIAGINVYLEWGRNDFSPNMDFVIRYPFHTEAYTFGIRKSIIFTNKYQGELLFEVTKLESSRDYELLWGTTFYAHHIISQGYTNDGQWVGAGMGTGGNSQYLGFKLNFPKGYGQIFVQRRNPDLDYTWFIDDSKKYPGQNSIAEGNIRAFLDIGISSLYYIYRNISVFGSLIIRDEHNPLNKSYANRSSIHRYNFYFSLGLKCYF